MLRTEALQDLSETHSHRMVVTLVIVVLVLVNTLYVADQNSASWSHIADWLSRISRIEQGTLDRTKGSSP